MLPLLILILLALSPRPVTAQGLADAIGTGCGAGGRIEAAGHSPRERTDRAMADRDGRPMPGATADSAPRAAARGPPDGGRRTGADGRGPLRRASL
ncbi:MAG: hypothetical protein ACK4OP_05005 [Gemmobacter sp.]